jgi:hypothetical protein
MIESTDATISNKPKSIEDISPSLNKQEICETLFQYLQDGEKHNEGLAGERKKLREVYNNIPVAYMGQQDTDQIYSGGLVNRSLELRIALVLADKPRCYLDPYFKGDARSKFEKAIRIVGQAAESYEKYVWIADAIRNAGGSFEGFFNQIIDINFQDWWDKSNFSSVLECVFRNAMIDTSCYLKWSFGVKKQIIAEPLLAEDVFVDPAANMPEAQRFVIHRVLKSCRSIQKQYNVESVILEDSAYNAKNKSNDSKEESLREKKTFLYEAQIKHCEYEDGEEVQKIYIFSFLLGQETDQPGGMLVVRSDIGEFSDFTIIELIPNLITMTKGFPLARYVAPLQHIDDKSVQQGLENFKLMGNGRIICETGAIINDESVTNRVASVTEVTEMGALQYIPPMPVLTEALGMHNAAWNMAQQETGQFDAAEGRTGNRVDSSRAIIKADEFINRSLRPVKRTIENFLKRAFSVWGEMFLYVHVKDYPTRVGIGKRTIRRFPFALSAVIDGFNVAIGPDTTMPKDAASVANMVLTLAGQNAEDGRPYFDRKLVLETLQFEGTEEILGRFDATGKMMAQIQQQAQGIEEAKQYIGQMQQELQRLNEQNKDFELDKRAGTIATQNKIMADAERRKGINSTTELKAQVEGDMEMALEVLKSKLEVAGGDVKIVESANTPDAPPGQTVTAAAAKSDYSDDELYALMGLSPEGGMPPGAEQSQPEMPEQENQIQESPAPAETQAVEEIQNPAPAMETPPPAQEEQATGAEVPETE